MEISTGHFPFGQDADHPHVPPVNPFPFNPRPVSVVPPLILVKMRTPNPV